MHTLSETFGTHAVLFLKGQIFINGYTTDLRGGRNFYGVSIYSWGCDISFEYHNLSFLVVDE